MTTGKKMIQNTYEGMCVFGSHDGTVLSGDTPIIRVIITKKSALPLKIDAAPVSEVMHSEIYKHHAIRIEGFSRTTGIWVLEGSTLADAMQHIFYTYAEAKKDSRIQALEEILEAAKSVSKFAKGLQIDVRQPNVFNFWGALERLGKALSKQ